MKRVRSVTTDELIEWLTEREYEGAGFISEELRTGWINYSAYKLDPPARAAWWERRLANVEPEVEPVRVEVERNKVGKKVSSQGDKGTSGYEKRVFLWIPSGQNYETGRELTGAGGAVAVNPDEVRRLIRDEVRAVLTEVRPQQPIPLDASNTNTLLQSLFGAYKDSNQQQNTFLVYLLRDAMRTNRSLHENNIQLMAAVHGVEPSLLETLMEGLKENKDVLGVALDALNADPDSPKILKQVAGMAKTGLTLMPDDEMNENEDWGPM